MGISLALRRAALASLLLLAGLSAAEAKTSDGKGADAKRGTVTIRLKPGQSQAEIEAAIKAAAAAGRDVTIVFGETPAGGAGTPAGGHDVPDAGPDEDAPAAHSPISLFQSGLSLSLGGIPQVPQAIDLIRQRFAEAAGERRTSLLWSLALLIGLCGAVAFVARALLQSALGHLPGHGHDAVKLTRSALQSLLVDLVSAGLFLLLAWGAMTVWLVPTGFARRICGDLVEFVAFSAAIVAIGRFLLVARAAGTGEARTLVPIPHPGWHRFMLNFYCIVGILVSLAVSWTQLAGAIPTASKGVFLIGSTLLSVQKLIWFWVGRRDIATLFAGSNPSSIRTILSHLAPWVFIAIAVAIWVIGCMAAVLPDATQWGAAAGATQILVLVVPLLALGLDALLKAMLVKSDAAERDVPPLRLALQHAGRTLVSGSVWIAGLWAILLIWRNYLVDERALSAIALLQSTLKISVALVVGWAILRFLRTWFRAYAPEDRPVLPGQTDHDESHPTSRLSTILPLFRDTLLGVVVAVTALVVLSSIGVDIAPLLAGFGVIGLALSFGSQALVKDIVSGVFFIADDAFRVGEYLDTGRHKGTVERISLRSIRLRHQNGQIHTVPFGQIQAITNFSRDWNTVKFELRFDPSVDPEAIRKVVKKVGLGLLEHPEFGPQFLQPLKMQGIQEVTPTAMVVRLKFSAKPGNPTALQRESVKRLLSALRAANLPLASNAITVRSGTPEEGAAAAQQVADVSQAAG